MADWSSILPELVGLIANKLSTIEDYSALTAVCRSYMSATKGEEWRPYKVSQSPWLLLSCQDEDDGSGENPPTSERGLVSLYRNRKKFSLNLPELHGRRCWGSSIGWILTSGLDKKLHLFNPLNRRRIALPDPISLKDLKADIVRKHYIDRAALIKRPSSSSGCGGDLLVVTADTAGQFRVMRSNYWADVKFLCGRMIVQDVICYKSKIYAVGIRGMLLICSNFDGPDPPTADKFVPMDTERFDGYINEKFYLVESLGELLLIVRHRGSGPSYPTIDFEVYKLDFETKRWIEIEDDLGDCALFVGACQSISLSPVEDFNCRRNCIYFTDDNYELMYDKGGHDMGIYDFKGEGTFESLYTGDGSFSTYSTPTWFIPNFS